MSKFTYDIVEESPAMGLSHRYRYEFIFLENEQTFYLVEYWEESRPSKRHKWKAEKGWVRTFQRGIHDQFPYQKMTENQVKLDHFDKQDILEAFMKDFKVKKWSERKV